MKVPFRNSSLRKAFTLVELLVVILLIVVLMSLVMASFSYFEAKKREDKTKITVERLNMYMQDYLTSHGNLPDGGKNPETSSNVIYSCLFGDFDNDGKPDPGAVILYEDLDPTLSAGQKGNKLVTTGENGNYVILDGWGKPYRYRLGFNNGGKGENPDFDIWSAGADGIDGTKDDITNGFSPTGPK